MNLPRLDSLTIRQLRVFCTVARLLSYTRAAEELELQTTYSFSNGGGVGTSNTVDLV